MLTRITLQGVRAVFALLISLRYTVDGFRCSRMTSRAWSSTYSFRSLVDPFSSQSSRLGTATLSTRNTNTNDTRLTDWLRIPFSVAETTKEAASLPQDFADTKRKIRIRSRAGTGTGVTGRKYDGDEEERPKRQIYSPVATTSTSAAATVTANRSDGNSAYTYNTGQQGTEREKTVSVVSDGLDMKRLLTVVRGYVSAGRPSMVLSMLRDKTSHLSATEVNFLATKTMNMLGDGGMWRSCADILVLLRDMQLGPDAFSVTAAMSVYIRHKRFEEAMTLFDDMERQGLKRDNVVFINGVRAAGFCRPWSVTLKILEQAFSELGDYFRPVADTAITNLKYHERGSELSALSVSRTWELLEWMIAKGVEPSSKTMDAALAVTCTHGTEAEVRSVLDKFEELGVSLSDFTFNTLLNRCAMDGNIQGAVHVITSMRQWGHTPDQITYNTLLKLCVKQRDVEGAEEVIRTMSVFGVEPDAHTKALLIQLRSSSPASSYLSSSSPSASIDRTRSALDIIDRESDENVTSYMFASAISGCHDWKVSLQILQRASKLRKADEAVFTAAAQSCAKEGQFDKAFKVIETMTARGLPLNKYSFSFIINGAIEYAAAEALASSSLPSSPNDFSSSPVVKDRTSEGFLLLQKYLYIAEEKYPYLLTNAVCQKVMKELTAANEPALAVTLHLGPLSHNTCKAEILGSLFNQLQELSAGYIDAEEEVGGRLSQVEDLFQPEFAVQDRDSSVSPSSSSVSSLATSAQQSRKLLAARGLALIALYCSDSTTPILTSTHSSSSSSSSNDNAIMSSSQQQQRYLNAANDQENNSKNSNNNDDNNVDDSFTERGGRGNNNNAFQYNNRGSSNSNSGSSSSSWGGAGGGGPYIPPSRYLLRTAHFNNVLRLLTLAGMFAECEELFRMMSGISMTRYNMRRSTTTPSSSTTPPTTSTTTTATGRASLSIPSSSSSAVVAVASAAVRGSIREEERVRTESTDSIYIKKDLWTWKPSIFTIAELIRASKEAGRPQMTVDVAQWAVREGVALPPGVVSDAVSYVYSEGRTDLALELYTSLYSAGLVEHWSSRRDLEMDLHNFSRGMAFAAIQTALHEIGWSSLGPSSALTKSLVIKDKADIRTPLVLTVITGKNITKRPSPSSSSYHTKKSSAGSSSSSSSSNNGGPGSSTAAAGYEVQPYTLSSEIQSILIEDFFPPISSSTAPGNPGRLFVTLPIPK